MDPVEAYLQGISTSDRDRDRAVVTLLRDIAMYLGVLALGDPEEQKAETKVEVYVEDGRVKRREVPA